MSECLKQVEERFSATDFEAASVLARRAEAFAATDAERARLVLLQATLLFHSSGAGTPEAEQLIVTRFELARKLDPSLTALSIPAYARSQKLEALWERAQPPAPPPQPAVAEPKPAPAPAAAVTVEAPRSAPIAPVTLTAFGVAAVAVGAIGTGLHFARQSSAGPMQLDRQNVALYREAELFGTVSVISYSVAGAALLAALVTWLVR